MKINIGVIKILIIMSLIIICQSACKKFLDAKSSAKLVLPESTADLQALLDDDANNRIGPGISEIACDNYYLPAQAWQDYPTETDKRLYTWEKDNVIVQGVGGPWFSCYSLVNKANTVLHSLNLIKRSAGDEVSYNTLKGGALFLRGSVFHKIALIWCLSYDKQSGTTDPGIPLRLSPDFNQPTARASLEETYDQIIKDLKESAALLPSVPVHVMRPSKPAAYGVLARVYLSMREYDSCLKYAQKALEIKSDLLDFNTDITITALNPFKRFNKEVIYHSYVSGGGLLTRTRAIVDSFLYASYDKNDLRKSAFFGTGSGATSAFQTYKGTYAETNAAMDGIAVDEVLLMRAECNARKELLQNAADDLNLLLLKRFKSGTYNPLLFPSKEQALQTVLKERRKELILRSTRWMDIKRLNKEGAQIALRRILKGVEYVLPVGDLRFAIAIPEDVINMTGIQQNPR